MFAYTYSHIDTTPPTWSMYDVIQRFILYICFLDDFNFLPLVSISEMSSSRPNVKNANVSGSVLSRSERSELAKLHIQFEKSARENFTAPVWKYFGELWHSSDDDRNVCIDTR